MKNYSDNAVSRTDLANVVQTATRTASELVDAVDRKQDRQIMQLRWAVGITFILNVILTLALTL